MSESMIANGALHEAEVVTPASNGTATPRVSDGRRMLKKRRGAGPFDALLWRLQSQEGTDRDSLAVGLIGCESGTGVSTLAANLAVRASELQLGPVLLIEADAERPRIATSWTLASGPGLSELLAGEASFADCLRKGPAPGLHVIPAAARRRWDASAFDPRAADALIAESQADHRLVLFDFPAADRLDNNLLLARRLDQVLLVIRSEHSRAAAAQRVADRLLEDGVPLKGVVLNRQRSYLPGWVQRWV
jgi:tyrosine-protein kinase Etk/Wzc